MKKGWTVVIVTALTLAIYIGFSFFQPSYTYPLLDPRFDAHQYAKAYNYFKGYNATYELSFPFHTRVLMPWLAAHLPFNDLKTDFVWLNGIFIVLTVALLTRVWLKLNIRPFWIAIALFWILFHWKGLVRMYLPDPVTADVGGYFWLAVCLTLLLRQDSALMGYRNGLLLLYPVAMMATLQKESFIAVIGITVVWAVISSAGNSKEENFTYLIGARTQSITTQFLLLFCVCLGAYYGVAFLFPPVSSDWRNNALISILRGMRRYLAHPELFLRLPVSWLLAYGPFWLALVPQRFAFFPPIQKNLTSDRSLLTFHCFLWLFLSIAGGGDTTRILFNGMPFVLTFLLLKLNQQPNWAGWYVFLTSLPLMRLMELEPDLGRYPSAMPHWCVECWAWEESWPYGLYFCLVLAGYYYLSRRFGTVGGNKTNQIKTHR